MLLMLALALTLAWRLTAALGWDAALDVLTGVHTSTDRGAVWRSLIHAGATMGTFVFAPILAAAGASWLVVRRLFERHDRIDG
ncbi:hypothetical protein DB30_02745 [Enhygromyxa salina]|uniref:Uncharacterized protein n=1 Tax=Enhygromyxa salina TaxID=215803 RepID=A0A0C1ZPB6_9BACT|nr:hypothetical protein DB30_02745 [Enhygromyxa salina]